MDGLPSLLRVKNSTAFVQTMNLIATNGGGVWRSEIDVTEPAKMKPSKTNKHEGKIKAHGNGE
jgi:hypothetical protein